MGPWVLNKVSFERRQITLDSLWAAKPVQGFCTLSKLSLARCSAQEVYKMYLLPCLPVCRWNKTQPMGKEYNALMHIITSLLSLYHQHHSLSPSLYTARCMLFFLNLCSHKTTPIKFRIQKEFDHVEDRKEHLHPKTVFILKVITINSYKNQSS